MSQKQNALLAVSALFAKINDNYSKLSYDDAEFRAIRQEVDAAVLAPEVVAPPPVVTVHETVVPDPEVKELQQAMTVMIQEVSEKLDAAEDTLAAIIHLLPAVPEPAPPEPEPAA